MRFSRSSGILLHPTSLPGKYGIGSLGKEAYDFVDFLIISEQKLWQIFPLGPTGYGDSPYQCFSAFAGNPLLISLEELKKMGLLTSDDLENSPDFAKGSVDYGAVIDFKYPLLRKAFIEFNSSASSAGRAKFAQFCAREAEWLEDYALFMALKNHFGGQSWTEWEDKVKFRSPEALDYYRNELAEEIEWQKFMQYLFFQQWMELKAYANRNGVQIIGDIPIFVAFDSADAWARPELFQFDKHRQPLKVAGVPPDYFSATGQLWGNPLYDWEELKSEDYQWWIDRFSSLLELVDIIRLDHFRGFESYWAVPYGEETAINGTWEPGPGGEFFTQLEVELGELPIIAEDLGVITEEVEQLRDDFDLPGMKVLQFAFDSGEDNNYLPHNYPQNSVVYTGTHDNDTTLGWYNSLPAGDREYVQQYLNFEGSEDICWQLLRAAWSSVAVMAIAPLQDLLALGSEARMNTPGITAGNWQWRYQASQLESGVGDKLRELTRIYHR
ncbi:4-alpha-glucanotransferase [Fuchsiella alkaliacetigena]|uniref:4-alpha-glucanotransferase n=1 Tax=Fuchsiella alkaliacetigena TaxID=957042 RepID=UPI00200B5CFC|nr:4-alpha-glucanotransferase [Fuchsiella alkaliacetigena]MCK8823459.1 4-alpha-glucanotransferase [Fuchsiella alkaliacetigena]